MKAGNGTTGSSGGNGFSALGLEPPLVRAVDALGFTRPTPVQAAAIPPALEGRDVLGSAATGSGKTAAFLLPILQRLSGTRGRGPRALILAPTRELAAQIDQDRQDLGRRTAVTGATVFGGVGMGPQEEAFRKGADIVVATPGRLLDLLGRGTARLETLEVLVLDEADRMLDMGFLPDIRRILGHLPDRARQTMLFSATMPGPILALSRELLKDPARVQVERRQAPARGIEQALFPVPQHLKVELLVDLLDRDMVGNAIVFCRTKHRANRLAQKLERRRFPVARIHGNRSQKQRTEALGGFRSGQYRVLVATDIMARGIDVEALDHVVNFDVPNVPEDYIHRVGRTGRAEATGEAYTFVAPDEEPLVRGIERAIGRPLDRRVLPDFDYDAGATERFEVPIEERIAEIRARKREERARAAAKAERRESGAQEPSGRDSGRGESGGGRRGGGRRRRGGGGRGGGRPRGDGGGGGSKDRG